MRALKLHLIILLIIILINNGVTQKPLISTPGCRIPDYEMKYLEFRQNLSCAKRFVHVNKLGHNKIEFTLLKKFDSCIYSFIVRSNVTKRQDYDYSFWPFLPFENNTIAPLSKEFVHVVCIIDGKANYTDSYAFVKPIGGNDGIKRASPYNVLMVGLETIPRKRAYHFMKETVMFLNDNNWLDFRGFNKVGENTIPNLHALLTGTINKLYENATCLRDMSACNHRILWHSFQEKGYVTAYGEDTAHPPGIFQSDCNGFSAPPTNHYLRPFFLAVEMKYGCLSCSGHQFTGLQILNYILDYTTTYRARNYFGFFFITTFSHDINQSPKSYDSTIAQFFRKLDDIGVYKDTFVIFFSDHGIRYGPARYRFESYYDERLPMLFMSVPDEFKETEEYENLVNNQHRLISHFDLHLTVRNILKSADLKAEDCPRCMSLFRRIPVHRTCSDAGISERWCSCFLSAEDINQYPHSGDYGALYSLVKAMVHMKTLTTNIATKSCTRCAEFSLEKLVRIHSLVDQNGSKLYLLAFIAKPNDLAFEVTVRRNINRADNMYSYAVSSVQLISHYDGISGWCAKVEREQYVCVCKSIKFCFDV